MRKRPDREIEEKKFVENAEASIADQRTIKEDLHKYVKRIDWPIVEGDITPSLAEGSNLRKHLTLSLTEKEWNSIDRHTKALGINKTAWVRYAIFKSMQEEQIYCFKNKS
jgi:hypothetical protein